MMYRPSDPSVILAARPDLTVRHFLKWTVKIAAKNSMMFHVARELFVNRLKHLDLGPSV